MNYEISVFYCFPRSGGTLINQCLLCAPENVVLSEVNPARSVIEPEVQAADWFGLLSQKEAAQLRGRTYIERIEAIAHQARKHSHRLCLRDWVGVNFLPDTTKWSPAPSSVLEQKLYLERAGFRLREARVLRRSATLYSSLQAKIAACATLSEDAFAGAYRTYLEATAHAPTVHLETFTRAPRAELERLCKALEMAMPEDFESRFHLMQHVTGNTTLSTAPASATWKSIVGDGENSPASGLPNTDHTYRTIFEELDILAGYTDHPADER